MSIFIEKAAGHFGNVSWNSFPTSISLEMERDLLWRVLQTSPDEVAQVVHAFWPAAKNVGDAFHVDGGYQVMRRSEVCGAFCRAGGSYPGAGDWRTKTQPSMPTEGLYLGPLLEAQKGVKELKAPFHIARRANIHLSHKGRYLFDKKVCHERVLFEDSDATAAAIAEMLNKSYVVRLGYAYKDYLHYNAENGMVDFAIVRFCHANGETVLLPVTAWKALDGPKAGCMVFDLLHPAVPYTLWGAEKFPLYRDMAHSSAVVCGDGYDAHTLSQHHRGLCQHYVFTTYSDIAGSDWGSLGKMPVLILPKCGSEGCLEAFKLYKKLRALGTDVRFLPRRATANDSTSLAQDIVPALLNEEDTSPAEFAVFCRAEYGVEPPDGILPQGVPILEIRAEGKQEVLLDKLLCLDSVVTRLRPKEKYT